MALSTSTSLQNRSWFADLFTDERVKSLSHQVSTLRDRVWELERKNTLLLGEKGKLEKQLEETKNAAEEFASQKQEVERSLKGENDSLRLEVLMTEQKYNKSEAEAKKVKMELEALAEAKEVAAKAFDAEKAKMVLEFEDLRRIMEEIQATKDLGDSENNRLRSEVLTLNQKYSLSETEVERLKMELVTLVEAKEAAAKAFEAEKVEIMKETNDLKRKVKEIQESKDSVMGENDKLQSMVLAIEEKHSFSEAEIERLKMELSALAEAKQEDIKAFDVEKVEIMKELEDLKRKVEEIEARKDLVMGENERLRLEVLDALQKHSICEADVERLKVQLVALEEAKEATAKAFDNEKAEIMEESKDLKQKMEEIQASKNFVIGENDKLLSKLLNAEQKQSLCEVEVERLKMEMNALLEAKEAATKAFDVEKAEIMMELEDLKRKVEELQASKDLVKGENDKLLYEVLRAEQNNSLSQAEIERLNVELGVLVEAKGAAAMAYDAEKAEIIKELEDLKRKVEENPADKLRAELEELRISMSNIQASYDQLDAKHSHLNDDKISVEKALDTEKAKAAVMKSKIEALENYNAEKDGEIGKLKATLEEKMEHIDALSNAIAEEKKKKCNIRGHLSSAKTCLPSCILK